MILGRGISSQTRAPFFTRSTSLCVDNRTVLISSLQCSNRRSTQREVSRSAQPSYQNRKKSKERRSISWRKITLADTFRLVFFFFFNLYPVFENKSKFVPIGFYFIYLFFFKFLSKLSFKLFLYFFICQF